MCEANWLGPVLEAQLLYAKVLLEHLSGAVERHLDVSEDGEPLPVHRRPGVSKPHVARPEMLVIPDLDPDRPKVSDPADPDPERR